MSTVRSALSSLALMAGSVFLAGLLFEVYCRVFVDDGMHYHLEMWKYAIDLKDIADDPAIGHRHIPGASARLMGVDVKINPDGLRDEPVGAAGPDALRVLMLGDSITFGWGVPQDQTVAAHLERLLSQSLDRPVEVINAGVGNYNTAMEVAWFERYGQAFAADVVLLNVFINDAEPTPLYTPVRWWDRLLYSRVILFGATDTLARTILGGADWKTYYRSLYADSAEGWRVMSDSVKRLAASCQESGTPLIIADYPELRELDPYPFADVSTKIANLADVNGAEYVPLLPALVDHPPESLWVTPPDPHPNALAARLIAGHLAPSVARVLSSQF